MLRSLVILVAFAASAAHAQSGPLDFTLLDAPYNFSHGGRAPSMRQSLDVTVAAYELAHGAIQRAFGYSSPRRRRLGRIAVIAFDYITTAEIPLPFLDAWLHEEFHRAQMGRRGVGSFNDVYKLQIGASAIYVSHVRDEDLIALKANHPADWVRVGSAGMEGELLLARELETRIFRGMNHGSHGLMLWLVKLGTMAYVQSATWADTDDETDEFNRLDGADVARRDFTGHDFLAWVYDLHRPNEPYTARGVHPSGVGIDRYIKTADLTDDERRYITRQGRLQFLNFVDPFLFGMKGFRVGGSAATPTVANASLAHFLTASGYVIDANLLVRRGTEAASLIARAYVNDARVLPGVEATAFDRTARIGQRTLQVTPRVALWLQPKDQEFRTDRAAVGGLMSLRAATPLTPRLGAFGEIEAKSAGWVAGNPYLDPGVALRGGVRTGIR